MEGRPLLPTPPADPWMLGFYEPTPVTPVIPAVLGPDPGVFVGLLW